MFHGMKKSDMKKRTPEEEKKNEETLKKLKVIQDQILKIKSDPKYDEKTMAFLFKAGALMPDYPTLWSLVKQLAEQFLASSPAESFEFLRKQITDISKIMLKNPKSYLLWYHRLWCIIKALDIEKEKKTPLSNSIIMEELKLTDKFLKKDSRNFHVWNYRVELLTLISKYFNDSFSTFINDELEYCLKMVKENFSNFSAWHYRAKLIPIYFFFNKIQWNTKAALDYFANDLEMIKRAIYTDPKDQSPWNYHLWIIDNFSPIYIENIIFDEKTNIVHIKYSNVFKLRSVIEIIGEGVEIVNKEEFSSTLSIKIPDNVKDKIIIKNKILEDINFDFDHLSLVTNKVCFTKQNLTLPSVEITKGDSFNYKIDMSNLPQFQIDFLKEQEKMIEELIINSTDYFIENAHYRLAQLYNIFYQIASVSSDEKEKVKKEEYKNKQIEKYKLLKEKSSRKNSMYEVILKSLL